MPSYLKQFLRSPQGRSLTEQLVGNLLALLIVIAVTAVLITASFWLPIQHVMILYLIPVIVAALRWGSLAALLAGVLGLAASAFFFYEPIYDFRVHSPAHLVDMLMFITVAAITGWIAVTVRQAKMRAQAESLRDALIGSVSHELRTPLSAIVGSTSVLAQSTTVERDEHLSSLVRVVRNEAERLNGNIQNLLDATRISSDGIQPHWEWVDPEDIVSAALARKRPMLAGREVALAVADDLPLAYVDPSLIESALGQLIENAAKYSPANTPITVSALSSNDAIYIEVGDKGAGLAAGEASKIFERFYRSPRVAGVAGSGLGLWIARSLTQACGGRIKAFSAGEGHGTTVSIALPVRQQPASEEGDE